MIHVVPRAGRVGNHQGNHNQQKVVRKGHQVLCSLTSNLLGNLQKLQMATPYSWAFHSRRSEVEGNEWLPTTTGHWCLIMPREAEFWSKDFYPTPFFWSKMWPKREKRLIHYRTIQGKYFNEWKSIFFFKRAKNKDDHILCIKQFVSNNFQFWNLLFSGWSLRSGASVIWVFLIHDQRHNVFI